LNGGAHILFLIMVHGCWAWGLAGTDLSESCRPDRAANTRAEIREDIIIMGIPSVTMTTADGSTPLATKSGANAEPQLRVVSAGVF